MTRPQLPGTEHALLNRVVVRMDEVETSLVQVRSDLDTLSRAVGMLTATVRKLPNQRQSTAPGEQTGQRDWLTVTDPAVAMEWLIEVTDWWDAVGVLLVAPGQPCWPWHPRAVTAALALQAHYVEAYGGAKAPPVSDLLIRWAPSLGHLVVPRDSECNRHEHQEAGRAWTVHRDQLPDYAHWWATERTGTPPGLTPRL